MNNKIQHLPDGTIELTITIPWSEIEKIYNDVVNQTVQNAEISGFRKGKAPRNVVEEKLDKNKTYEAVLKRLIPDVYQKAVEETKIKPIITPKIELSDAIEKKDWVVRAQTCEKPALTIGDYKKAVTELKVAKTKKIWVPGQETPQNADKDKPTKPTLDEILKTVYDQISIILPTLLIDHEVNRLLSDLIDQTKKLRLNVEQYLSSTGRTAESIRNEYINQAKRTLSLEFALEEIANRESITVTEDDISHVIKTAKTDEEKKTLENQRYYIASVLRRQKTLDFLASI
jgi:trigger factor